MFSAPEPKNTKIAAASVASQGVTPARRITVRSSAAATRCSTIDHRLVRRVAVHADEDPHQPVREDRQRHPVLEVRAEEVVEVAGRSRREEVPVVLREPTVAAPMQQQWKRDDGDRREAECRRARRADATRRRQGCRQRRLLPLHRAMTVRCPTIPPTPQRPRALSISHGQPVLDGRQAAKRLPSRPGGGSRRTHRD